jgi:hypothetical protein
MPFTRTFDEDRSAQGFVSQAHLDAFFAYRDHTTTCTACQTPGAPMILDDGMQSTRQECPAGTGLFRASLRENVDPEAVIAADEAVADEAPGARHPEADVSPVSIERSDAIDAAAGLLLLARHARRDAASRRSAGPNMAPYRAGQRAAADVYEAAARRVQRAADEAL